MNLNMWNFLLFVSNQHSQDRVICRNIRQKSLNKWNNIIILYTYNLIHLTTKWLKINQEIDLEIMIIIHKNNYINQDMISCINISQNSSDLSNLTSTNINNLKTKLPAQLINKWNNNIFKFNHNFSNIPINHLDNSQQHTTLTISNNNLKTELILNDLYLTVKTCFIYIIN